MLNDELYATPKRKRFGSDIQSLQDTEDDNFSFLSPLPSNSSKNTVSQLDSAKDNVYKILKNINLSLDIATPPTPKIGASPILTTPNKGLNSSFTKLSASFELSDFTLKRLQRLGWIGEHFLQDDIESCLKIINEAKHFCQEKDIVKLTELWHSFIDSAITYLEHSSRRNLPYFELSQKSLQKLKEFNEFAIIIRKEKGIPEYSDESGTPFYRSVCKSVTNCSIEEDDLNKRNIDLNYMKLTTSPFNTSFCDDSSSSSSLDGNIDDSDKIHFKNGNKNIREQSTILSLVLQIIQKESVSKLASIFTNSIPTEFLSSMNIKKSQKLLYFASPVRCFAQEHLGNIWNIISRIGIGTKFLNVMNEKAQDRENSKKNNIKKVSLQSATGSLNLMGPKRKKRGKYTSKKSVKMKIQRTSRRNEKIKKLIQNIDEFNKSP